jgi:hypothetical protein
MPKRYLRRQLTLHNSHYAPTHLHLLANENAQKKEYEPKLTRYNPEKDRAKLVEWKDPALEEERVWIVEREQGEMPVEEGSNQDKGKGKAKAVDGSADEEPELEDGEGIECQCCFCEYPFVCILISFATALVYLLRSSTDRPKWFNARKPIFSALPAFPNTPLPNSVLTALLSFACILLSVNNPFLNLSCEECWITSLCICTTE